MSTEPPRFTGSVPEHYERHLVPVMFQPFADDLGARLGPAWNGRALEVACGSGVVTRTLIERMGPGASLVATDLEPGMVEEARRRSTAPDTVEWRTADALALPFEPGSFDLVVCQFGAMFFPDRGLGFREMFRVSRPGARLLFNVWAGHDRNPNAAIAHAVVTQWFPDDPPQFYRVPYGWNDETDVRATVTAAGWNVTRAEWVERKVHAESAESFARGIVLGTPMAALLRQRGADDLEPIVEAVAAGFAAAGGERPCVLSKCALVVEAVRA